jgi:hypothetical protein
MHRTHARAGEHKARVENTEAKLVEVLKEIDDDMNRCAKSNRIVLRETNDRLTAT